MSDTIVTDLPMTIRCNATRCDRRETCARFTVQETGVTLLVKPRHTQGADCREFVAKDAKDYTDA